MQLSAKAKKYFTEHYGQLLGFEVTGIGVDESDETGMEPTFCLVMKKGREQINVFISADGEGNGPGFLEIEPAHTTSNPDNYPRAQDKFDYNK